MDLSNNEKNDVIDLNEFIASRLPLIREDYFIRNKDVQTYVRNDMQMPVEAIDRLVDMCNPLLLNRIEDQRSINSLDDINSECLSSLDFVKTNFDKSTKRNHPYEIKFIKNIAKLNEIEPDEDDLIQTPDVILTVQISQALNSRLSKLAWSEDYLVLGQNRLVDLKDKISCFREEIRIGEFSTDPKKIATAPVMKDLINSGYFLIENVLYSDTRIAQNDFTEPVLKWAKEKGFGEITEKSMQEVKFIDLSIKLGFPYLYKHVGNCEHLIVFTSVKLVNPSSDCYSFQKYPIPKDKTRGRFTFCWCCNRLYAKWVVCGSIISVDDPTFLCERCFLNTHYIDKTITKGNTNDIKNKKSTISNEELNDENVTGTSGFQESHEERNTSSTEQLEEDHPGLVKVCDFKAYHFSQL